MTDLENIPSYGNSRQVCNIFHTYSYVIQLLCDGHALLQDGNTLCVMLTPLVTSHVPGQSS